MLYAKSNNSRLNPSLGPNNTLESLHWIGSKTKAGYDPFLSDWQITDCPNWKGNTLANGMEAKYNGSFMLGFIYSAGLNTNALIGPGNSWDSPVRLSDKNDLMLWADRIVTSDNWTAKYPHTDNGWKEGPKGIAINPGDNGNRGGNVLQMNGSAKWITQESMTPQKGSSLIQISKWWRVED